MTPEELARERKASAVRRQKKLEAEAPERRPPTLAPDGTPERKRGLTRAERLKLQADEFVPPKG